MNQTVVQNMMYQAHRRMECGAECPYCADVDTVSDGEQVMVSEGCQTAPEVSC